MGQTIVLNKNTPSVVYLCNKDKRLAKLVSLVGDVEYSKHDDGYAFLVHEIIEQMLSIKAGKAIFARLVQICEGEVSPIRVNALSDAEIKSIGTANSKVKAIRALTEAIITQELNLTLLAECNDDEVIDKLMEIRGIGWWTAKMYLIFVLDRPDVLPFEDVAFQQVFRWLYKNDDVSKASIEKKCKKWKPYSSIAARYFYRALDSGLTGKEFHLYK